MFTLPIGNSVFSHELVFFPSHNLSTVWTRTLLHWLCTLIREKNATQRTLNATAINNCYYVAGFVSGQDELNPAL